MKNKHKLKGKPESEKEKKYIITVSNNSDHSTYAKNRTMKHLSIGHSNYNAFQPAAIVQTTNTDQLNNDHLD